MASTASISSSIPATLKSMSDSAAMPPSSTVSSQQQQQQAENGGAAMKSSHRSTSAAAAAVASPSSEQQISYSAERIIGNGSFGVVFQAAVVETGEIVAIKKVLQDKRFKNRELQIMRQLVKCSHSNIVALKHCFYSQVSF